jgi:hypothetical protein
VQSYWQTTSWVWWWMHPLLEKKRRKGKGREAGQQKE